MDETDPFSYTSRNPEGIHALMMMSFPSEARATAQEFVKTLIAKGYVLGKGTLIKAKAFDESHQVSATTIANGNQIGLTSRINAGMDVVRSVDKRYHVTDMTKSAIYSTRMTVMAAAVIF